MKLKTYYLKILVMAMVINSISCKKDDDVPKEENETEIITDISLIFTNSANPSDVVTARAQDTDGIGIEGLKVLNPIDLKKKTTYTLTFEIKNKLANPEEDLKSEILKEGEEHQIFFSFSDNAFSKPTGNGNIDKASDPLEYKDHDENGNPIGLSTSWTTSATTLLGGSFKAKLQHQPDIKTATSGADDGDTDFEIEFVLNIK